MIGKIDPVKGIYNDFLKNVSNYELEIEDVTHPYTFSTDLIKGFATEAGTSKYSKWNPDVIEDNFKKPFGSQLKFSSMGYGTYMGAPDDKTDYEMY